MSKSERNLCFSGQHPSLEGHFPNDPIVPAAAILAELISQVESEYGESVTGVVSTRFRAALRPEIHCSVAMEQRNGRVEVVCKNDDAVVMKAIFSMRRP